MLVLITPSFYLTSLRFFSILISKTYYNLIVFLYLLDHLRARTEAVAP